MPDFPHTRWQSPAIDLITPAELATLAPGTKLVCIDGRHVIVGKDTIDGDTRQGFLAYGFLIP
jgi:hypothetical protein